MAKLIGINEIKKYLGVSESTTMDAIFNRGLPAKKNESGEWVAKQADLKRWLDGKPPAKKPGRKPKKTK